MTIMVVPKAALGPAPPSAGIFWRVDGVLVVDRSTLEEAEPYGDCITHAAGHYERRQAWQALGTARLTALGIPVQVASTEYDQWPEFSEQYAQARAYWVLRDDQESRLRENNYRTFKAIGTWLAELLVTQLGARGNAHRHR